MVPVAAVLIGLIAVGQTKTLPHLGTLSEQLRAPAHVAVALDNSVLVSDPLSGHVARFDDSGALLGTWPVPKGPIGVAVHPDGRIFVSLRDEAAVAIYNEQFELLQYLGGNDPQIAFAGPTTIDIAADTGRIYVVDSEADRVYGFESGGDLVLTLGSRGSDAGELLYPSAVAVDEERGRLVVADHDNFRIQVFTTSGLFLGQFGHRLTSANGRTEGWIARPLGLDVDSAGNIYLSDALMSTVRVFDPHGREIGRIAGYGFGLGDVRVPCGVTVSHSNARLYVASINSSSVEIFSLTGDLRPPSVRFRKRFSRWDSFSGTDSPLWASMRGAASSWDGPHVVEDRPDLCAPCHGFIGQPGGHAGTVEGQSVLCMSCHNSAGRALRMPIHERDAADPFATDPVAPDGRGRSHAWGVAAVNSTAHAIGPRAGGAMSSYLGPEGLIKCSTCHDQHNLEKGPSYVRVSNEGDAMCKECHEPLDRGVGEGGSHPVGSCYPGGEDEYPGEASLAGLEIKNGMIECLTCHAVHNADSGGVCRGEGDGMLLRAPNDESLCRACHTRHMNHDAAGDWQPTCFDCHATHEPPNENAALISRTVDGVPMTFAQSAQACNEKWDLLHALCDPPTYDGICEVCHTDTDYHRNESSGDHEHHADVRCTVCHPHSNGFLTTYDVCADCHGEPPDGSAFPNLAGAHAVHQSGVNGPGIRDCSTCHPSAHAATHMDGVPSFTSGVDANIDGNIDLAETDVCDACHSPAGPFDGVNDPVIGAKANWEAGVYDGKILKPDKIDWCLGCHDGQPAIVNDISAPLIAGDNRTWGYNVTGHGPNHVLCTECHDPTLAHTDGVATTFSERFPLCEGWLPKPPQERELDREAYNNSYRLLRVDGGRAIEVPRDDEPHTPDHFRLCFSCHDEIQLMGVPANYWLFPPVPDYLLLPEGVAQTNFRNESEWGFLWLGEPTNTHWHHIAVEPAFWDLDHDGLTIDSRATCPTCHNPHGAQKADGSPTVAMTVGDLAIGLGVYNDGTTDHEYGYIGSDAYMWPDGDLHCWSCHADVGPGRDPPNTGLHARYYRKVLVLHDDECRECHTDW